MKPSEPSINENPSESMSHDLRESNLTKKTSSINKNCSKGNIKHTCINVASIIDRRKWLSVDRFQISYSAQQLIFTKQI